VTARDKAHGYLAELDVRITHDEMEDHYVTLWWFHGQWCLWYAA